MPPSVVSMPTAPVICDRLAQRIRFEKRRGRTLSTVELDVACATCPCEAHRSAREARRRAAIVRPPTAGVAS